MSQPAAASASAAMVLSPSHGATSASVHNIRPNRLRMSFRRGPSPCDTFDNETDSSADLEVEDEERSALGISSPTSSSAWS